MAQSPIIKPAPNNPHSNNKLCSEFAPRNREYSAITQIGNTISELTPNNSHFNAKIENAIIPHSFFALNHSADWLDKDFSNFRRIANSFHNILVMSHSNDETLMQMKHSTPSKVQLPMKQAHLKPHRYQQHHLLQIWIQRQCLQHQQTISIQTHLALPCQKIFSSTLMASLTSKDAILKEIQFWVLTDNEDSCRQVNPYIHSFWKDLHVKNGCVCIDDRIAIPNSIKDAYVEAIHATHPGSWGWQTWRHMHDCRTCIGTSLQKRPNKTLASKLVKNKNYIIPSNNWAPLKLCKVPNEEIQIDFGGPIYNEKNQEVFFLACKDRFSKFPTAELFDRAKAENILKFLLQDYVLLHGIPRTIRLD